MVDDENAPGADDEEGGIGEILDEKDTFRLVIRGFALVSDELDEAISNAFGDPIPRELSGLRLPSRLALARALRAVSPELSQAIQRLGKIRHRLAHTMSDEATSEEALDLWQVTASDKGSQLRGIDPHAYSPGDQLRLAVAAIWAMLDEAIDEAAVQRHETEKAISAFRERRDARLLSLSRALETMRNEIRARSDAVFDQEPE